MQSFDLIETYAQGTSVDPVLRKNKLNVTV